MQTTLQSIGLYPIEKEPRLIARYSGRTTESIPFPISRSIDIFAVNDDYDDSVGGRIFSPLLQLCPRITRIW